METQQLVALQDIDEALDSTRLNQPPSVLSPAALTIQAYCRSKTFIARSGVNPLAAAASALFSLIAKLRQAQIYEDMSQLRLDLVHEIKAFECAAIGRHYQAEQIIAARYVICATLDETISRTVWGSANQWAEHSLVAAFQENAETGERVFALLDRLRETTHEQLDLLEFFYLCLSLGFEGKYRTIENGRQALDSILDNLYRKIRHERGDTITPLIVSSHAPAVTAEKTLPALPLARIIGTATAILVVIYLSFIVMLHIQVQPVYQLMTAVASN